jgi:hypothetical protein
MKKLINYLSCLLMVMLASASLTSCGGDDGPGKIELTEGESSNVSVAANTSSGSINFTAAAPWSAYTSAQSRSSDDAGWIHLDTTNGSAGEVSLTFTLDDNTTGSNRTAYIIIICEDDKLVITITQTTETEDSPEASPRQVQIEVKRYVTDAYSYDGTDNYVLLYNGDLLIKMTSTWRDDIDGSDKYCISTETAVFRWDSDTKNSVKSVKVEGGTKVIYYPSLSWDTCDDNEHYAEFKNGRAVKGWYKWDDDDRPSNWEATYNNNGYLASSKNDDGDGSGEWSTHTLTWTDGCLTNIGCTENYVTTITYDASLTNPYPLLDLNWLLPTDLECYDLAVGDPLKIFAALGLMGNPSKYLITSITEYDGKTYYSNKMDYKENTSEKTVVTVTRFINNSVDSYSEWTINYK